MTDEKDINIDEINLRDKKVSAISLGCDKNRVDLEHMLFSIQLAGFEIVSDISNANIIIVNTCAFIQPAIDETIDNINIAIKQKIIGRAEKIIVSGCFPQRDLSQLSKTFPQVDCFLPLNQNCNIANVIKDLYNIKDSKSVINNDSVFLFNPENLTDFPELSPKNSNLISGRIITHNGMYAYLKIADGCSNGCAYCTIPKIKGRFRSVPMNDLIKEAKMLAKYGYKELILVAQDTAKYGDDLYGEPKLIELLKNLTKINGINWIRLQYVYTKWITDELIDFIASEEKMCKYIDIPLQHIDDEILKAMNRKSSESEIMSLLNKIKTNHPQIILRSTFIIGLPGETKEKFNKLCKFISKGLIDYATFFPYYRETNTKAYYMKNQVHEWVKKRRVKKITQIQNYVMNLSSQRKLGSVEEVLIDEYFPKQKMFKGHSKNNSPNIDLCVIINQNKNSNEFEVNNESDFIKKEMEENQRDNESFDCLVECKDSECEIDEKEKLNENLETEKRNFLIDYKNKIVSFFGKNINKIFKKNEQDENLEDFKENEKLKEIRIGEIYKVRLTEMIDDGFIGQVIFEE